MATDMAKVRRFEDGQKLSIWGKIAGFIIQDMDYMVTTDMAKERDGGCMEYPGCGYWWQEEGESDFFLFRKEAEGFQFTRVSGIGSWLSGPKPDQDS